MWFCAEGRRLSAEEQASMMVRLIAEARKRFSQSFRKVLVLPPDLTRYHSGAGSLTNTLYHLLAPDARVHVIPTLGQHRPHTASENQWMFGDIPGDCIHVHDWQATAEKLGEIESQFVRLATGGRVDRPLPVEINPLVRQGAYDLIVNIGQVVPHEVLGFANHNKNYFIGLGGKATISASHLIAALCGIEANLGQIMTPLRACYNEAERRYLHDVPDVYVLIVQTPQTDGRLATTGLYVGNDVSTYVAAAGYARQHSVSVFDQPMQKIVCFMDPKQFRSTWVTNKAIYRTRMAVADGGEIVVIAPGVERFGEQAEVDELIRTYGYRGTAHTMRALEKDAHLRAMGHAAAHLMNGSTEGRFSVTYAAGKLSRQEVEGVGFQYMDPFQALKTYNPAKMREGLNVVDGKEIYWIGSAGAGLWTARGRFIAALRQNATFVERIRQTRPQNGLWGEVTRLNDLEMASLQANHESADQ